MGNICGASTEGELLADKARSGNDADVSPNEMIRVFEKQDKMWLKQTRRGCCQEWCCGCCAAESEFRLGTGIGSSKDYLYIKEDSNPCCGNQRSWTTTAHWGADKGGTEILKMRRPLRPMPAPCKLCCYQVVWVEDVQNDKEMGYVRETCYCCVPTYGVFDTNDRKLYDIHQPTCCCGTCVNCCAGAGCCGRTPFHIYLAGDNDKLGEITKYFPTLPFDVPGDADIFKLDMPPGVNYANTSVFLAAAVLINQLYFESDFAKGGEKGEEGE